MSGSKGRTGRPVGSGNVFQEKTHPVRIPTRFDSRSIALLIEMREQLYLQLLVPHGYAPGSVRAVAVEKERAAVREMIATSLGIGEESLDGYGVEVMFGTDVLLDPNGL